MEWLKLLLVLSILGGCKKKSFADNIVLVDNSKIEMKFQDFNEGIGESGSSVIYVGKFKDSIPIKFYESLFPAPPLGFYLKTKRERKDSIALIKKRDMYFLEDFDRIRFSEKPVKFDSLTSSVLEIVVKPNDTIPHFVIDSARNIKAYKSFPVFKNISGTKIILPENKSLATFVLNQKSKWQLVLNDNAYRCGYETFNRRYYTLNADEIIIFSVVFFKGKETVKFKGGLSNNSCRKNLMELLPRK